MHVTISTSFYTKKFISTLLAHESDANKEVDNVIWKVFYSNVFLGYDVIHQVMK